MGWKYTNNISHQNINLIEFMLENANESFASDLVIFLNKIIIFHYYYYFAIER